MFTEILNSFLNVRNKVKNADGDWVDQTKPRETQHIDYFTTDLREGDHVSFDRWGDKIIIDSIEYYVSDRGNIYPRLNISEGSTGRTSDNLFLGINASTGAMWDLTVLYINNHGSNYLDAIVHDSSDDDYKVVLKRPITLPEGGRLTFSTNSVSGDEQRIRALVYYRVIEE